LTLFEGRPLIFMVVGVAIGPVGTDLVSIERDGELIRALLEFALVVVLFADAMAIRSAALRRQDFVVVFELKPRMSGEDEQALHEHTHQSL
jgi:NhaP-type Na+/H+ or K+/H+ antiporter